MARASASHTAPAARPVGTARLGWIAARATEYTVLDLARWIRGANRGSGAMWDTPEYRDYSAFRDVPRLNVPTYFFTGRHDYNTPLELIQEYVDVLDSPAGKQPVVFEHSAHTPFWRSRSGSPWSWFGSGMRPSRTIARLAGPPPPLVADRRSVRLAHGTRVAMGRCAPQAHGLETIRPEPRAMEWGSDRESSRGTTANLPSCFAGREARTRHA